MNGYLPFWDYLEYSRPILHTFSHTGLTPLRYPALLPLFATPLCYPSLLPLFAISLCYPSLLPLVPFSTSPLTPHLVSFTEHQTTVNPPVFFFHLLPWCRKSLWRAPVVNNNHRDAALPHHVPNPEWQ